jgi:hypothetical protein
MVNKDQVSNETAARAYSQQGHGNQEADPKAGYKLRLITGTNFLASFGRGEKIDRYCYLFVLAWTDIERW